MSVSAVDVARVELLPMWSEERTVVAAGTRTAIFDARGFRFIRGHFFGSTAAAAGFPRVRQSRDNVAFDRLDVIAQDFSQANFTYEINDLPIVRRFVSLEWTSGAADANPFRADIVFVP